MKIKISLVFLIIFIVAFTGCGISDYSAFILADLNATFKNDVAKFSKLSGKTPEALNNEYDLVMKRFSKAFTDGIDFTSAETEIINSSLIKMFKAGSYTVGKAKKVPGTNTVTVPVTVTPVTNLATIYAELQSGYSELAKNETDTSALEASIKRLTVEIFEKYGQTIDYGNPVSLSVSFNVGTDKKYDVNEEELAIVKQTVVLQN